MAKYLSLVSFGILLPAVSLAQAGIIPLIDGIIQIAKPVIALIMGCAVVAFFWGLVKFINHAGDEKARDEGKNIIIWGLISIFVMVTFYALIGWLQNELGLNVNYNMGKVQVPPATIPAGF